MVLFRVNMAIQLCLCLQFCCQVQQPPKHSNLECCDFASQWFRCTGTITKTLREKSPQETQQSMSTRQRPDPDLTSQTTFSTLDPKYRPWDYSRLPCLNINKRTKRKSPSGFLILEVQKSRNHISELMWNTKETEPAPCGGTASPVVISVPLEGGGRHRHGFATQDGRLAQMRRHVLHVGDHGRVWRPGQIYE